MNFFPIEDESCPLLKIQKTETPKTHPPSFTEQYCVGHKCAYYNPNANLCMRPSLCPFEEGEKDQLSNIRLKRPTS